MSESKFGFEPEVPTGGEADDVALQFKPTPINVEKQDLAMIDAIAASSGFSSRESRPAIPLKKRRVPVEPTRTISIRAPLSIFQRFVAYADEMQLTYNGAIDKLLDEVGYKH